MRFIRLQGVSLLVALALTLGFTLSVTQQPAYSQETTGGMQGTVTDPSGAVVPKATVTATAPTLVGSKAVVTDAAGYYRFANLPPGTYTLTVKATGFETLRRQGIVLEVGHLPSIDLQVKIGQTSTVVEVKTEGPLIDATTNTTLTNIPEQALTDLPHGTTYQSVIQFAPAARNEPLQGSATMSNGSGGSSPGSASNGSQFGYSIAGGADSENSYLIEGQETANIIGGYSKTTVPMDFIQEVQLKTSGVDAEYGGALGGVVNVIMDKGTNQWHGAVFTQFTHNALNGGLNANSRYDPSTSNTATSWGAIDPTYQNYQPIRPHAVDFFPGASVGGPLLSLLSKHPSQSMRDRLYAFLGFNPDFNNFEERVNYGPTNGGVIPFSQNTQTYYSYARIDAEVTQKIRVYGSWLYQLQRQAGEALPGPDSTQGYFNTSTGCFGSATSASNPCLSSGIPAFAYSHNLGYVAPNITLNTGADITLTNSLVSTTRFGYYFENYHDAGYPTTGTIYNFQDNGLGNVATTGAALSQAAPQLNQAAGYFNIAQNANYTHYNANKAIQFDQDIAWFHAGGYGTHNLKFGYQLNRDSNAILQKFNTPYIQVWPGTTNPYSPQGAVGAGNCATVEAANLANGPSAAYAANPTCVGTYGTVDVYDYGSNGSAVSYNNGFYVQDSWTIGKGITLNYGLRIEHEALPAENQPTGSVATPINFGWGSKVAPRIGAAWDVFKNGKMKVFGGFGEYYDQMKLNLAISSYGGQYWQECWYALMTPDLSSIAPQYNSNGRYCVGPNSSSQANFGSSTPSGLVFLENQNIRAFPTTCSTCSATEEGTAPGLKPYAQHDSTFGIDYQLGQNLAIEARWDRRRLDHVIEDSAIFNPAVGETFVIVNPGQGVNSTFTSFYNFLYGQAPDCSNGCPPNKTIPAARSYDGVEFRITKAASNHWMGMFSYTYSHFRGNYTGLTSSDIADGGGGRNAPNNSRSFDEPYFSWNANGGSSSGLLPTDRPNALKGYAYYDLPWLHQKLATDFGISQFAYSGSPLTTYADVGYAFPGAFPTDIVNRGKWIDVTQNSTTGVITTSAPYTRRTPAYLDTDFNFKQTIHVTERQTASFDVTFTNLLNQHSVTALNEQADSGYAVNFLSPQTAGCGAVNQGYGINSNACWLPDGPAFYAGAMSAYNYTDAMNNSPLGSAAGGAITQNSQYAKPYLYELSRTIRFGFHYTF